MAIPDAVLDYLRAIDPGAQVASAPNVETWYNVAVGQINASPWGANYALALALVTAHYCLTYPDAKAHLDRTPVQEITGANSPVKYMPIAVESRDAFWLTTAPGRQYFQLRKQLLGNPTPRVV